MTGAMWRCAAHVHTTRHLLCSGVCHDLLIVAPVAAKVNKKAPKIREERGDLDRPMAFCMTAVILYFFFNDIFSEVLWNLK